MRKFFRKPTEGETDLVTALFAASLIAAFFQAYDPLDLVCGLSMGLFLFVGRALSKRAGLQKAKTDPSSN